MMVVSAFQSVAVTWIEDGTEKATDAANDLSELLSGLEEVEAEAQADLDAYRAKLQILNENANAGGDGLLDTKVDVKTVDVKGSYAQNAGGADAPGQHAARSGAGNGGYEGTLSDPNTTTDFRAQFDAILNGETLEVKVEPEAVEAEAHDLVDLELEQYEDRVVDARTALNRAKMAAGITGNNGTFGVHIAGNGLQAPTQHTAEELGKNIYKPLAIVGAGLVGVGAVGRHACKLKQKKESRFKKTSIGANWAWLIIMLAAISLFLSGVLGGGTYKVGFDCSGGTHMWVGIGLVGLGGFIQFGGLAWNTGQFFLPLLKKPIIADPVQEAELVNPIHTGQIKLRSESVIMPLNKGTIASVSTGTESDVTVTDPSTSPPVSPAARTVNRRRRLGYKMSPPMRALLDEIAQCESSGPNL